MKNFVIGIGIALAATQAAGCIITSDGGDYATVGATWRLTNAAGAVAPNCPPGYDTAALFNVAVNADGSAVAPCTGPASVSDTCFVDLFNCTDFAGVSAPLPPTRYRTWVAITDGTGTNTYAQSLSAFLDVRDIDLDFNTSIVTDGGYFSVDWDLKGAVSQAPLTCTQAGATGVETVVTVAGGTTMFDSGNGWACEDYYGVTKALPAGSYTVSVDAFNANGALGTAPEFTNKAIQGPNKVTDLGTAIISIDGL
jgi:hypothetical protein